MRSHLDVWTYAWLCLWPIRFELVLVTRGKGHWVLIRVLHKYYLALFSRTKYCLYVLNLKYPGADDEMCDSAGGCCSASSGCQEGSDPSVLHLGGLRARLSRVSLWEMLWSRSRRLREGQLG
jgi:hypothetical protein